MDGNSEAGRFLEDQSKARVRFWIHSMVSFASSGQDIGSWSSGGGCGGDEEDDDGGCGSGF